jgi:hypothetical protein
MRFMRALLAAVVAAVASLAPAAALAVEPGGAGAPAPRKGLEPVGAVVRRCVDAYGGKPGFARSAVRREEGRVTSLLHPGDAGRIVRSFARPGRLRVEVAFPGSDPEVRVLDGARGWRGGEEATGPKLDAMVLQAARLDVVALLAVPGTKITDGGTAMVKDTVVRVLSFEPAPGLTVEAQIDPKSGRVLRTRGSSGGPHVPVAFETTYGEFRKVDGVLVAFHEWNWANGRTTGETVLEKVEFPRELPKGTFEP